MVRTAAVAAMACALASCGPAASSKSTAPGHHDDPNAPKRKAYVVTEAPGITMTASDDHFLYWVDSGGLKRRPHGGSDEKIELITDQMATEFPDGGVLLVVGEVGYILHGPRIGTISVVKKDQKPEIVVTMPTDIQAYTVATDGSIYIANDGSVLQVEAGKAPKVLASGQGDIDDVIVDDKFVYIAANDTGAAASGPSVAPPPPPYYGAPTPAAPMTGSLRKVPRDGGKVVELAGGQAPPGALAVYDNRLWWCALAGGAAVSSVPIDGGEVRVEAKGRSDHLAVDAGGLVYKQNNEYQYTGMIVEHRNDKLQVDFAPDGTFNAAGKIVLSPDWVYVDVNRYATGTPALVALPRQTQPVQIAFDMDRAFSRLEVDDDGVYWAELTRDADGHVHIMRGDPEAGTRRELGDYEGTVMEMAIGGGQVYFDDNYTISQVATAGGEVRPFDRNDGGGWKTGLTVHRNHVYWFDGTSLYARKRRGGAAFVIATNNSNNYYGGYGYYGGDSGGDLVFDDDYVYTTGFGQGGTGVFQISERGQVKLLWDGAGTAYPGKDLVMIGDELFFVAGQGGPVTVMKVTSDGEGEPLYHARSDGYGGDLIEAGGMLYLLSIVDGFVEVTRIDPGIGEGQVLLRISNPNGEYPTLGADSNGVYFGMDAYDAIFRIAYDAPAVLETGWPADAE